MSWNDVQEFLRRLNAKKGGYRFPTEAEWEYAARAGSRGKFYFGDDEDRLARHAWYHKNAGEKVHPVAQLLPNAWGLYDMLGNVEEWVQDWYSESYYPRSPSADPPGPAAGSSRVRRGGSWNNSASNCRSASRYYDSPGYRSYFLGFRPARSVP